MRRLPSRLFAVALVVTLTLGGSAPAGAADRTPWHSLPDVLAWLAGWWSAPRIADSASAERVPSSYPQEAAALAFGAGQDPLGRTPPPPSPLVLEGSDFD